MNKEKRFRNFIAEAWRGGSVLRFCGCTSYSLRQHTHQNMFRRATALCISALFFVSMPLEALAVSPDQFSGLDDATYEKLLDNTAEWNEIENLVTGWNPTYRLYAGTVENTNNELSAAGDTFSNQMNESLDTIDENLENLKTQREKLSDLPGSMIIDAKGTTVSAALAQLDASEQALKNSRTSVKKGMGQVNTMVASTRISTNEQMKTVREQLTRVVEGLFISYAQLKISRSLVEKQIELYERMLATQESLKASGMATEAETASARASLGEAKITLQTVDNGIAQLRTAIGLQLGWSTENPPEIGDVPAPDTNYPSSVNKEEDYKKALDNNSTYEETGKLSTYTGSSAIVQRDGALNEADAKAGAAFDSLYAAMQQQKALYDAAQTSLKLAELKKSQAARMAALGLAGDVETIGMELQYLSCEASARQAELSLASAINDYKWAVKGYMDY